MSLLTTDTLQDFLENGYVVIEGVLPNEQIEQCRTGIHEYLEKYKNIKHEDLLSSTAEIPRCIRKKGLTSELFYSKFKMDVHLNPRIYLTFKELCAALDPDCHDVLPYIDRVGYRLPDHILAEGGLKLHVDRNPWNTTKAKKIRPIQAFVTLTDHYGSNSGGLRVVPKFQKIFDTYFAKTIRDSEVENGGEFYRMHGKEHTSAQQQLETIQAPAGSLVIWNNNLPHATCERLESYDTREVLYLSYLPDNISVNRTYFLEQANHFLANIAPPSYCDDHHSVDRDYDVQELTDFQRQLLGIC